MAGADFANEGAGKGKVKAEEKREGITEFIIIKQKVLFLWAPR